MAASVQKDGDIAANCRKYKEIVFTANVIS